MTKKHFEMIARVLHGRANAISFSSASVESKHYAMLELRDLMYNLGDEFLQENPRFDKGKFYKACDIQTKLEYYIKLLETV